MKNINVTYWLSFITMNDVDPIFYSLNGFHRYGTQRVANKQNYKSLFRMKSVFRVCWSIFDIYTYILSPEQSFHQNYCSTIKIRTKRCGENESFNKQSDQSKVLLCICLEFLPKKSQNMHLKWKFSKFTIVRLRCRF